MTHPRKRPVSALKVRAPIAQGQTYPRHSCTPEAEPIGTSQSPLSALNAVIDQMSESSMPSDTSSVSSRGQDDASPHFTTMNSQDSHRSLSSSSNGCSLIQVNEPEHPVGAPSSRVVVPILDLSKSRTQTPSAPVIVEVDSSLTDEESTNSSDAEFKVAEPPQIAYVSALNDLVSTLDDVVSDEESYLASSSQNSLSFSVSMSDRTEEAEPDSTISSAIVEVVNNDGQNASEPSLTYVRDQTLEVDDHASVPSIPTECLSRVIPTATNNTSAALEESDRESSLDHHLDEAIPGVQVPLPMTSYFQEEDQDSIDDRMVTVNGQEVTKFSMDLIPGNRRTESCDEATEEITPPTRTRDHEYEPSAILVEPSDPNQSLHSDKPVVNPYCSKEHSMPHVGVSPLGPTTAVLHPKTGAPSSVNLIDCNSNYGAHFEVASFNPRRLAQARSSYLPEESSMRPSHPEQTSNHSSMHRQTFSGPRRAMFPTHEQGHTSIVSTITFGNDSDHHPVTHLVSEFPETIATTTVSVLTHEAEDQLSQTENEGEQSASHAATEPSGIAATSPAPSVNISRTEYKLKRKKAGIFGGANELLGGLFDRDGGYLGALNRFGLFDREAYVYSASNHSQTDHHPTSSVNTHEEAQKSHRSNDPTASDNAKLAPVDCTPVAIMMDDEYAPRSHSPAPSFEESPLPCQDVDLDEMDNKSWVTFKAGGRWGTRMKGRITRRERERDSFLRGCCTPRVNNMEHEPVGQSISSIPSRSSSEETGHQPEVTHRASKTASISRNSILVEKIHSSQAPMAAGMHHRPASYDPGFAYGVTVGPCRRPVDYQQLSTLPARKILTAPLSTPLAPANHYPAPSRNRSFHRQY